MAARSASLFDLTAYGLAIDVAAATEDGLKDAKRRLGSYLVMHGVATSTAYAFVSDVRTKLDASERTDPSAGFPARFLVTKETGLEVVADSLVNCRLSAALALLEYDPDFDSSNTSNTELADLVGVV